jgi:hypothetical protein
LFKRQSDMATLIAVAEDRIPPAEELDSSVPPELSRIITKSLERDLAKRYQSAQEMRADLENLIRSERWEGDALALQGYMRELFNEKLRAQDADIKAAGLASLDDFLLQVEESTRISWMPAKSPNEKRTPSVGLPSASDKPTPKAPPALPGVKPPPPPRGVPFHAAPEAKTAPEMKAPDLFQQSKPATGAFAGAPTLMPPGTSKPNDPTAPAQLPADRTMIVPGSGPIVVNGHAHQPVQDVAATAPGTMQSPFAAFSQGGTESTAKWTSFDPPETGFLSDPRKRRLFIIACVVLIVTAVTLTIVLWPSSGGSGKTVVLPTPDTPTTPDTPVTPTQQDEPKLPLKVKPKDATLNISCDTVAVISVDGEAQPAAKSVDVKVKPNVAHVITATRPGHHTVKTIRVQPLNPGESLPIKISVK